MFSCSLIDDGKNPDEFTRDVLNSCIAKNQVTKGKTDAFKVVFISSYGISYSNFILFSTSIYVFTQLVNFIEFTKASSGRA